MFYYINMHNNNKNITIKKKVLAIDSVTLIYL